MKAARALCSALEFLLVVLVLFAGIACVALGSVPFFRERALKELLSEGVPFIWFGSLLLAFGLLLLLGLALLHRGRYYQVRMGVLVDPALICSLAERYWKEEFPQEPCEIDVKVDRGLAIELYLTLPHFPPEAALRTIERDLSRLLAAQLGLSRPFKVHVLAATSQRV
jgi:hypothetical protein